MNQVAQPLDPNRGHRLQIADYTFQGFLGEGNYGAFYLAQTPPRLGVDAPQVAVKVLLSRPDRDALSRLARELQIFAAVQSPHLVTLLDAGQQGDTCYYAMAYYAQGSLAAPHPPLSRSGVLAAVAAAARGAEALHQAGVVHRDIKPENILLAPEGAKLSDLGLALLLEPGRTITGMGPIGSVEYTDPALIRGDKASRATDVWALGVTLHRVLTGQSIYAKLPADDPILALRHVLTNPPTLDASLDPAARAVIAACLAPEPRARPGTALAVAEQIAALAT